MLAKHEGRKSPKSEAGFENGPGEVGGQDFEIANWTGLNMRAR
jgi:hypothetical protein